MLRLVLAMMEDRGNVSNSNARLRRTKEGGATQKKKCHRMTKCYFHVFQKLHTLELEQELAKLHQHNKNQRKNPDKETMEEGKIIRNSLESVMDSLDIMELVTKRMETMKTS